MDWLLAQGGRVRQPGSQSFRVTGEASDLSGLGMPALNRGRTASAGTRGRGWREKPHESAKGCNVGRAGDPNVKGRIAFGCKRLRTIRVFVAFVREDFIRNTL